MTVWRIAARSQAALDGEGARLYGSRWTPRGLPAVFASATLALATLERFVHTDPDLEVPDLVAIAIELPARTKLDGLAPAALPPDWRAYPAPMTLAILGERWLRTGRTVGLWVPSVVVPHERNLVLNPRHPDFGSLVVAPPEPFAFDPRLWKR